MATMSLSKALNSGLRQAMERDPKVVLMGEDIGKLGGVFRVTEGLQRDFGDRRVIDTPLAESGVVGTAVGLAMRGYRPVCEIQFDGFIYPAFDQIVSQVAKLRYRNEGRVSVPLTIRVPFGGGVGAVEHHSESPEAYFAHTAGLRVVTPSNAADGYRMIQQSIASDDPVVFFEPKRRYWEKGEVDDDAALSDIPLHRAAVLTTGSDVTIAAYGPIGGHGAPGGAHRAGGGDLHRGHRPALALARRLRDDRSVRPQDGASGRGPRGERVRRPRGRNRRPRLRALLLPPGGARPPGRRVRHAVPALAGGASLPPRCRPDPPRGGPVPPAVVSALQHFVLPDLGEGLADAELVAWHVAVGDVVALNQVLVEVETEKAVVELPSPFGGTVVELMVAAGETVSVGAPLIAIDSDTATATPTPSERDTARGRRGRGRREGADAGGLRPVRGAPEPPAPQRQRTPRAGPRPHAHADHAGHPHDRSPHRPCASWPARTASTWRT